MVERKTKNDNKNAKKKKKNIKIIFLIQNGGKHFPNQ